VVKSGQVVRVKVLEVEPDRKRISLTLRLDDAATAGERPGKADAGSRTEARPSPRAGGASGSGSRQARPPVPVPANTAMAEALRRAGLKP